MKFILTPEISRIANDKSKITIIEGHKDTGKSTAGLYKAIKLSKKGKGVLFLTFTKQQAITLNKKIQEIFNNYNEKIKIINIDKVLFNFYLSQKKLDKEIIRVEGKIVGDFLDKLIWNDDTLTKELAIAQINKIINEDYKNINEYFSNEQNVNENDKKKIWYFLRMLKERMKNNNYIFLLDIYKKIIEENIQINNSAKIDNKIFVFDHIIIDNVEDLGNTRYNLLKKIFQKLFNEKKSTITFIGDFDAEIFLNSYNIKEKFNKLKKNKKCSVFKLDKVMRNITIPVADLLAKNYNFYDGNFQLHKDVKNRTYVYPYFIENIPYDKEYENIAKIIYYLKKADYSYNDINIITFSTKSLEMLTEFFYEEFIFPIRCNISTLHYGQRDMFEHQKQIIKNKESYKLYEEGQIECLTAFGAQKSLENKAIIIFDTITLDNINLYDNSEEMMKKRIMMLYETLYTSTNSLFIFGNSDKFSIINKLNKEEMECVDNIEDISLFYGIENDYSYLKKDTFDDYIKTYFNGDFSKFEKHLDLGEKKSVMFENQNNIEYNDNEDNDNGEEKYYEEEYYEDEPYEEPDNCDYARYTNNYYSVDDYIYEAFGGNEDEWEDYCEDIAERYDD